MKAADVLTLPMVDDPMDPAALSDSAAYLSADNGALHSASFPKYWPERRVVSVTRWTGGARVESEALTIGSTVPDWANSYFLEFQPNPLKSGCTPSYAIVELDTERRFRRMEEIDAETLLSVTLEKAEAMLNSAGSAV